MVSKSCIINKLCCMFLLLCLARVCQGHLMCYFCDNCPQITAETPQFECNEDFFSGSGTTDSSVQTTTGLPKTTLEMTEDNATTTTEETTLTSDTITSSETSTKAKTTEATTEVTTAKIIDSTTELIIETTTVNATERTSSTEQQQPPSPPTVGPTISTTVIPTPPNPDTLKPIDNVETLNNHSMAHEHVNKDEVESVEVGNATTKAYKPSAEFRIRQLRSVSNVTYHCYKIHTITVNGSIAINRGCSRVETMESVCGQWKEQHPSEQLSKCYPCSRTKCNGSSALNVSITALFVAVLAAFMHRK